MPTKQAASTTDAAVEDVRTGTTSADLKQAVTDHLHYSLGRLPGIAGPSDYYRALALAVRDRTQRRWIATTQSYLDLQQKVACYLSAEFLLGPHLGNNVLNLDIEQAARDAMTDLGQDLDVVLACEEEPGLGNGGLGRLAACYLDSLATLQCPAVGYGIRYDNTTRSGKFSSDRSISEYCEEIWNVRPVTVTLSRQRPCPYLNQDSALMVPTKSPLTLLTCAWIIEPSGSYTFISPCYPTIRTAEFDELR